MPLMCDAVGMASTDLIPTTSTTVAVPDIDPVSDLVTRWLLSLRSVNTRVAYRADLGRWLDWCHGRGLDPLTVRRGEIDAWARLLEQEHRPTTVARRLASLASFYKYAVTEGILEASPAANVNRPRTGEGYVELTPALDPAEVGRLVAAATGPRDRLLVLLLSTMALRISEALTLDLDGFETIRGHVTALVEGKGGRQDRMPFPPLVVAAVEDLAASESRFTGPLFAVTGDDGVAVRWNRHQATRALARLGRAAGILRTVRPHMLRASAVTRALDLGATLRDVQDLARHADPRTTRRYDRGRGALDRSPVYALAADLAEVAS